LIGQVYKAHSNEYTVMAEGRFYRLKARGTLKKQEEKIAVGDFVNFEGEVIKSVKQRKNLFIRPFVANIDILLIVISPEPKPDFFLIDKLLINAQAKGIKVIFVLNKNDLESTLKEELKKEYGNLDIESISISAINKSGIEGLKERLKGKLSVLAGQSAVGKTSLINAMFNLGLKTGELSQKIQRGKHTTTYSEIHSYDGVNIIDSPGFAVIDAFVRAEDLMEYYPEYFVLSSECKFRGCTHVSEPNCAVKRAVFDGKLSLDRYERYLEIYKELLDRREFL